MHESQTGRPTCHLKKDDNLNEMDVQIQFNNSISTLASLNARITPSGSFHRPEREGSGVSC